MDSSHLPGSVLYVVTHSSNHRHYHTNILFFHHASFLSLSLSLSHTLHSVALIPRYVQTLVYLTQHQNMLSLSFSHSARHQPFHSPLYNSLFSLSLSLSLSDKGTNKQVQCRTENYDVGTSSLA